MSEDEKPRKQFTPGSIVRVRGVLMGVGQASLRGLLDEAEDINDITQKERIAAREGVALEPAEPEKGSDEPVELTPAQKRAATIARNKAEREAVIKRGDNPADVDAAKAEEESKLGETSKPPVEPGTVSDGEPPVNTDEADTGRSQADGSEDPEAEVPEVSPEATDAEVEAVEAAPADEQAAQDAKFDADGAALAAEDVQVAVEDPGDGQ